MPEAIIAEFVHAAFELELWQVRFRTQEPLLCPPRIHLLVMLEPGGLRATLHLPPLTAMAAPGALGTD